MTKKWLFFRQGAQNIHLVCLCYLCRCPYVAAFTRRNVWGLICCVAPKVASDDFAVVMSGFFCIFASVMDKFQPYSLDYDAPAQGELLGEVKAGFPSPAEDIREKLDLMKLLVRHRASTFFFRVSGVSMVDADMDEGDIIIVDRAVQPYNDCKAVCFIDGEYTVKRIEIGDGVVRLMPANEKNTKYQPIEVTPENNFMVWGVVTYVIKKM